MSTCRDARRRLLERLDGTLALDGEFRLERHLAACARCRAHARRAAELEEGLARLPEPPTPNLDVEGAVRAVRARLSASPRAPRAARRPWRSIAAAALALAASSAWLARREGERTHGGPTTPSAPEQVAEAHAAPVIELAPAPLDGEPTLDPERLERAREEVRAMLAECARSFDVTGGHDEAERLAQEVDERTRALRVQGWPVDRIAGGLVEGPDAEAARAALRYLGVRPEPTTAARLARALERPELAPSCVAALADLGVDGLEGLARALELAELREEALAALVSVGGARAAAILADALRRLRAESASDDARALVEASLADLGLHALDPLLALGAEGELAREQVLFWLEHIPGIGDELVRRLDARPRGAEAELVLRGAARLAPESSIAGLEAAATERTTRAVAVECLASIQDPAALLALVRLRDVGRVSAELADPAVRASVELNAPALVQLVTVAARRADAIELSALFELVVSNEAAGAAAVLVELARATGADDELRLSALLALVELGGDAQLEPLRELFATFTERERRMAAACLTAIHALGGDAAADAALADAGERERRELLALLARRIPGRASTVSLVKLSRALAPTLGRPALTEDSPAAP